MNFLTILDQHPLLRADLKNIGLSNRHMHDAATEITSQLGGSTEFNLYYVISALTSKEFVRKIDTTSIAQRLEISPSLAQSTVLIFAPWVDQFQPQAI